MATSDCTDKFVYRFVYFVCGDQVAIFGVPPVLSQFEDEAAGSAVLIVIVRSARDWCEWERETQQPALRAIFAFGDADR